MGLRRYFLIMLCVSLLLPVFSGCGLDSSAVGGADGIVDVGQERLPCSEEALYGRLFDLNNHISVDIDMPETELQKLQQDYEAYRAQGSKSPIYRMATVTITVTDADGTTAYRIPEVGVRMKGNTSRTDFYSPDEGIYNYIHLKLDFQQTFDDAGYYGSDAKVWDSKEERKFRKNRTFATLEKLELRWNKCWDSSYLRETYAYELFRSEGVLAPMSNLSSLDWSGIHMGIYTIIEPVDEAFLEKRLPKSELGGDLYKCGWSYEGASFTSLDSIGIENEDKGEFYAYDLKTNKKTSQHEALKNLIRFLNSGNVTRESFAEVVDLERFLSFAAVSYFLGNPDDLRNNYNNYYLYFLKSSGKAVFIPYDFDRCLGITYEWDPTGNGVTEDDPFTDTVAAADHGKYAAQRNPLFNHSVVKGGLFVGDYAKTLESVAKNPLLQPETFDGYFIRARELYKGEVQPGKVLHNANGRPFSFVNVEDAAGNLSFRTYIRKKMTTYQKCMKDLDSYLHYERPVTVDHYIRGDFTGWDIQEAYGMTAQNGMQQYMLQFDHSSTFKVYCQRNNRWYGVESLPEHTELSYTTDSHGNIILPAGTYLVIFDPLSQTITVTKP